MIFFGVYSSSVLDVDKKMTIYKKMLSDVGEGLK
tara:strand:+ start:136 stop:237 length:102 start_codon:yes stop_codon:yes gene_type:complete